MNLFFKNPSPNGGGRDGENLSIFFLVVVFMIIIFSLIFGGRIERERDPPFHNVLCVAHWRFGCVLHASD